MKLKLDFKELKEKMDSAVSGAKVDAVAAAAAAVDVAKPPPPAAAVAAKNQSAKASDSGSQDGVLKPPPPVPKPKSADANQIVAPNDQAGADDAKPKLSNEVMPKVAAKREDFPFDSNDDFELDQNANAGGDGDDHQNPNPDEEVPAKDSQGLLEKDSPNESSDLL